MITKKQIADAAIEFVRSNKEPNSTYVQFIAGANWALQEAKVAQLEADLKTAFNWVDELKAQKDELLTVLRMLYDEQNDAPLERRRAQWQLAMDECKITLQKLED